MEIDPTIFKAYDIRGTYPDQLNDQLAYQLGLALAQYLKAKQVVVGQDARPSSDALADNLIRGLADQGVAVTDIGLCTSPMLLFACAAGDFDGGVMVTASHNPPQYNGFKLSCQGGQPIGQGTGLEEIRQLVQEKQFSPLNQGGAINKKEILNDYLAETFSHFEASRLDSFKIVADAGNGVAGLVFPEFFANLNCQVFPLYWQPDGSFPNHLANPLIKETLKDCQQKILSEKADLGIATDGDGDRIFFLDEKAKVVAGDLITALIAREILKVKPGSKIIYDVRSSQIVKETIEQCHGVPFVSRIGHSFFKTTMRKENIYFGGESSGHYYLKDNAFREAPMVVILYILKILTETKRTLSSVIAPFLKYFSSGEINFSVKDKEAALRDIERHYDTGQISHIDGLSVEYDDWNFNLRCSNTEPLLRLNLEADNQELLQHKLEEIKGLLNQY